MKAIIYGQHGGPEVLEYTDIPDPKIARFFSSGIAKPHIASRL